MKTLLKILSAIVQFILQQYVSAAVQQTENIGESAKQTDEAIAELMRIQDALATELNRVVEARQNLHNWKAELDRRAQELGIE